jgi:hypothetical protein
VIFKNHHDHTNYLRADVDSERQRGDEKWLNDRLEARLKSLHIKHLFDIFCNLLVIDQMKQHRTKQVAYLQHEW